MSLQLTCVGPSDPVQRVWPWHLHGKVHERRKSLSMINTSPPFAFLLFLCTLQCDVPFVCNCRARAQTTWQCVHAIYRNCFNGDRIAPTLTKKHYLGSLGATCASGCQETFCVNRKLSKLVWKMFFSVIETMFVFHDDTLIFLSLKKCWLNIAFREQKIESSGIIDIQF